MIARRRLSLLRLFLILAAVGSLPGCSDMIAQLLTARGSMPPVITRATEVGEARSRALFDGAYAEHARRIARSIDIQGGD